MSKRLRPILLNLVLAASGYGQLHSIGVGCPRIPVQSLDRSREFFTTVLGFNLARVNDSSDVAGLTPGARPAIHALTARLVLGGECLDIAQYSLPAGKPYFADSRANDLWFQHVAIVVSDMPAAYARLRRAHVRFVSGSPQTLPEWNRDAAGISAIYFRDPDGHYLELIQFPPGKGQPKWQTPSGKLFLGIDHTAIGISDTGRSLHFYEDQLRFRRTGASENYGIEQEHLSGVFNAHVLVTSLRSAEGIGIELLEYLTPDTGRPIPASLGPEDLACWEIPIEIEASDAGSEQVWPAARWVKLPASPDRWREAAWIQDPDGHRIQLVKRSRAAHAKR